jgi:hypothetical protein
MAHQLCDRCRQLSFTLHRHEDCISQDCTDKNLRLTLYNAHSDLVRHFPHLNDLGKSAKLGCHLCSLILVGLQSASTCLNNRTKVGRDAVYLFFVCVMELPVSFDSRPPETFFDKPMRYYEQLTAFWGNTGSILPVVHMPDVRYHSNVGNASSCAIYMGIRDRDIQLFPGSVGGH